MEKLLKLLQERFKNVSGRADRKSSISTRLRIQKGFVDRLVAVLVTSFIVTATRLQFELSDIEAALYDLRITSSTHRSTEKEIIVVALDDRTTNAFDEAPPLALDQHLRLLESLTSAKPAAIGWLMDLNHSHLSAPGQLLSGTGRQFLNTALHYESQGGAFVLGTPFDTTGEIHPPYPLNELDHGVALIHRDGNLFAEDKVTRRAIWSLMGAPTFHALLARKMGKIRLDHQPLGTYRDTRAEYFFFRWASDPAVEFKPNLPTDVRDIKKDAWTWVSWLDVVNGAIAPELFSGKIVLVGSLGRNQGQDYAFTPWSRKPFTSPKLAVHANIVDSILYGRSVVRGESYVSAIVTYAASVFVLACVLASTPIQGLLATLGLALGFFVITHILFVSRGIWVPSAHAFTGIILSYYVAVPYRLYREYRARWDYQERNKILTQVEEMKRNFVSLVTHDLKTPVARIQGLAEVLSRKAAERLNDRDQESIRNILHATDELNRFITSILELNRIDSANDFALNPESRDVNLLIEKATDQFKAQSRSRGNRIELDLEPQFPIRIDVQLVTRVLHNLIDNALKYSQDGGVVRISSHDLTVSSGAPFDGVEIRIADQGIGIGTEDLEKLFSRFHRAKNDFTTRVTGTGLGLYLSRYFIEAHGGTLEVESVLGEGSVFIIRLPVTPDISQVSSKLRQVKRTSIFSDKSQPNSSEPLHSIHTSPIGPEGA